MQLSGNVNKKSALIATIRELDRLKPGFMAAVKSRVRSVVGTPQKGMSGMFMGDWIDDVLADLDDGYISETYLPPATTPAVEENWWSGVISTVSDAAKAIIPAYYANEKEKEWAKIQLERARQGLPPIRSAGYGAPATEIAVTHKIPPGTIGRQFEGAFNVDSGTKQLLIGGAVVAGLFFLSK